MDKYISFYLSFSSLFKMFYSNFADDLIWPVNTGNVEQFNIFDNVQIFS